MIGHLLAAENGIVKGEFIYVAIEKAPAVPCSDLGNREIEASPAAGGHSGAYIKGAIDVGIYEVRAC